MPIFFTQIKKIQLKILLKNYQMKNKNNFMNFIKDLKIIGILMMIFLNFQ